MASFFSSLAGLPPLFLSVYKERIAVENSVYYTELQKQNKTKPRKHCSKCKSLFFITEIDQLKLPSLFEHSKKATYWMAS